MKRYSLALHAMVIVLSSICWTGAYGEDYKINMRSEGRGYYSGTISRGLGSGGAYNLFDPSVLDGAGDSYVRARSMRMQQEMMMREQELRRRELNLREQEMRARTQRSGPVYTGGAPQTSNQPAGYFPQGKAPQFYTDARGQLHYWSAKDNRWFRSVPDGRGGFYLYWE